MNCPNCNTEPFDSEANFCINCGTDIQPLKVTCVHCGAKWHEQEGAPEPKYCTYCGCTAPFKSVAA